MINKLLTYFSLYQVFQIQCVFFFMFQVLSGTCSYGSCVGQSSPNFSKLEILIINIHSCF